MELLRERYAGLKRELLLYSCNQVWMTNGVRFPWRATAICETYRTSCLTEKHFTNGDSANHLNDQSFHLVRWLNITLFLRHHVEPRVKLYVPRGEIIPNTTTIHRGYQSNKYDLGCDAWTSHRRLLEYRRSPRPIRLVDWIQTIHHIGQTTSRWVYMVRWSGDEETNDIQAWLLVARDMERHVRSSATKRKTKVGDWKTEACQC